MKAIVVMYQLLSFQYSSSSDGVVICNCILRVSGVEIGPLALSHHCKYLEVGTQVRRSPSA